MREGWTYKKIGSICNVKTGKLDANAANENGAYPFFTCSKEPLRINSFSYDAECVLIAGNGDLNVKYYKGKFDAYQRTYILTVKDGITGVSVQYLYLYFLLYVNILRKNSIGGVIKYIKLGDITEARLPIPPLSEQQGIVNELDLLSSIIEKKKEQLKAYDQLAQSIFYDMFGDPIENPKGWEVKKFGEVCKLFAGGDVPKDRFSKIRTKEYSIPIFSNGIENNGLYGYTDIPKVKDCCITISGRGTIGHVERRNIPFVPVIRLLVAIPIVPLDISFLTSLVFIMDFKGNGGAIPQLTVPMIKNENIILPPLSLQKSFAEKIEAIEKQKSLVQQSIAETETLFNSRMDYYFY